MVPAANQSDDSLPRANFLQLLFNNKENKFEGKQARIIRDSKEANNGEITTAKKQTYELTNNADSKR